MKFDDLVKRIIEENWEKGTSKAPKGKSFDMERGGAPSNVDAARDGSGGRYRRTRPPSAPSKKTHGEMEESPKEDNEKKKSDKVKIYRGKDYKVKVEKGKRFTKNGIYMKVYYQNPSLSKERHKQIANQIHRAISDEESPEEDAEYRVTLKR